MKVLFLSAWYPTQRDAMAGLFVQKHAAAVAQQWADVRVLYSEATGVRWLLEMACAWKRLHSEWGLPDVVQMNVLDKNGLLALYLRRRYHIPFVIIEHWTGYLPTHFSFRGGWHGRTMRHIASKAACIMPVSRTLEEAMKQCGIECQRWEIMQNVVDDFFYMPPAKRIPRNSNRIRLLHVSCFDEPAKNIQGLLRAYRKALARNENMELVVVGTGIDFERDKKYADSLQFPTGSIRFTGEVPPIEVCRWMYASDAFVLFSRYETFSVVLAECQAVGLPIITSRVAGIAENLPKECGIVVEVENETALTNAILEMVSHLDNYSTERIRQYGDKYRYDTVGKELMSVYHSVCKPRS